MKHLITDPHFTTGRPQRQPTAAGDEFYDLLIQAHHGLSDAQSELLNARLILLLANHIGDLRVLREALLAARPSTESPP